MRSIPYAGEALRVLGESPGLAICELTVPPRFAGPPAHIHHDFDEAIYVLSGALTMTRGRTDPVGALAFMEDIGAALPASGPPDPAQLAEIYRRHNSELVP